MSDLNTGVATFCRVKLAFSSNEVALPLAAEEGFTGLLENSRGFGIKISERPVTVEGLQGFAKEELLKVDSEGRCIITDHGHFGELTCFFIDRHIIQGDAFQDAALESLLD